MNVQQRITSSYLSTPVVILVGALALGWVMVYVDRSISYSLLPVIGEEFGLSGARRGAIASAYFAVYAAMQIPMGILGDRFGLKRVLVIMYLVAGVGLLAIGLLSVTYAFLLIFVGVHALGAAAYYSCAFGLTASSVPLEKRGLSSAIVTMGMGTGLALGLVLGGALYRLLGSWRLPYVILSGPTVLLAVGFLLALRPTPSPPREAGGFRFFLTSKDILPLCLATFCVNYPYWVLLSWAPSFLYQERGLNLSQAGISAGLLSLPSIAGALLWGRLSDQLGRKRILLVVVPVIIGSMVGLAFFKSTIMALAFLAIFGLVSASALNPLVVAWLGDHVLAARRIGIGSAIATFNAFAVGGSVVGPLLSGMVLDLTGSLEGAFYLGAGIAALGFVVALIPQETVQRRG